jgi:SAM-dependent methyltransferase
LLDPHPADGASSRAPHRSNVITQLDLQRPYDAAGGHGFIAAIPDPVGAAAASAMFAVMLEDGQPLGPSRTLHVRIRNEGAGAFSVWGSQVYFSASDNSDCNRNGRRYTLAVVDVPRHAAVEAVSADDRLVLSAVAQSRKRPNGFFDKFFREYDLMQPMLRRHRAGAPARVLEIGSGPTPYTAIRFLVEGARRAAVNDVVAIHASFESEHFADVRSLADLVHPGSGARLEALARPGPPGTIRLDGLDAYDRTPFEEAGIDGPFDLVYSLSALEHVKDPEAIARRAFALLAPGGYTWHGIDLRDHRDFARPLAFLEMSPDEYAAVNTENRLRASDWRRVFTEAGFEIVDEEALTLPRDRQGHGWESLRPLDPASDLLVDDAMRARFAAPFDAKDARDLSVLAVQILCRKP